MPIQFGKVPKMKRPDISPVSPPKILELCQEELDTLYPDRPQQIVLKKQIQRRMEFFHGHRTDFVRKPLFEQYGTFRFEGKNIPAYVMRFNHVGDLANLRIFFILYEGDMVLLHAFQETKDGSYEKAFDVAKGRLAAGK